VRRALQALQVAERRAGGLAMVPQDFFTFFATSAGAGAALVGLLFIAVSIAPHRTVKAEAPIERQAISASAFSALLNAFFISLSALIPRANLGIVTLLLGCIGMLSALSLTWNLLKSGQAGAPCCGEVSWQQPDSLSMAMNSTLRCSCCCFPPIQAPFMGCAGC
jgi:hypothetical protein